MVYLVEWPGAHVVKVGTTCKRRHHHLAAQNGRIVAIRLHHRGPAAYDYEDRWHDWMRDRYELAYHNATQAIPQLGGRGDGWRECYRLPEGTGAEDVLRMWLEHDARACPGNATERTLLTQQPHPPSELLVALGNARRAGAGGTP